METVRSGGFSLNFQLNNGTASLIGFDGTDSSLEVPSYIQTDSDKYPVTSIEKKAFLGCKGLKHITLPSSILSIGDWAFSQCIHLTTFDAPIENPDNLSLGRGVFDGCSRLNSVSFTNSNDQIYIDGAFLYGANINKLEASYLQSPNNFAKDDWFTSFDNALQQYLSQSEYSDSFNNALCGEEDIAYDDISSVDGELLGENAGYIQEIRKKKSYLCLIRLKHSSRLSNDKKALFEEYINQNSIGKGNGSSWQVVRDDFPDDKELFSLYLSIIKPDNNVIDAMLADLGGGHPQTKAQLLSYKKSRPETDSFFDELLL